MSARDGDGSRARHAVRTRLNHIVGYGDILQHDAEEAGRPELAGLLAQVRETAMGLREPLVARLSPGEGGPAGRRAVEELDRRIYGILFELIARVQEAKRLARSCADAQLEGDVEKILHAANGVLEILAEEAGGGAAEDEQGATPLEAAPRLPTYDELPPAPMAGRILVVDDNFFNRELLARHLERQGHEVRVAADGAEALSRLAAEPFDLMLLDVMMPGMNGYQLLERVRQDETLHGLHVIVISALEGTASIARCIQLGAEDYLPREFEPLVLKARIESCLEKKALKAEHELYVSALVEAQDRLRAELRGGAAYVRSLLPPRISLPGLRSDWMFIPSASLGGDVFGYHFLDPARPGQSPLALYLIDVSGHGIEAALFSVTLMNMLKTQVLPGADFGDPGSVLGRLNASFRMEEQNNLYFTAWYGVWDPASRDLRFASAGSPPAVLAPPGGGAVELESGGMLVGLDPLASYNVGTVRVEAGSRLFIFSDGIYEVRAKADCRVLGLERFIPILAARAASCPAGASSLDGLLQDVQSAAALPRFADDVSLLEFVLG